MDLSERYQIQVKRKGYVLDENQALCFSALDALSEKLGVDASSRQGIGGLLARLFSGAAWQATTGCYIWGGVGRGKTWLMDLFYYSLTINEKKRSHYSAFMQEIHQQLSQLEHRPNPLQDLAKNMAQNFRVLCLDEFHVLDITDAMLLSGLLQELFRQGVVLVVTSNQEPDQLYKNGLQRDRFLPAIELIKTHTQVVHLRGGLDHRSNALHLRPSYFITGEIDSAELKAYLARNYPSQYASVTGVEIAGRWIPVQCLNSACIWFDFNDICGDGRATPDYIFIARQFECVVITNVPLLNETNDDLARRFIHFIDILYDAGKHVVIGAEKMPLSLYQGRTLAGDFQRTASRLQEMATRRL